MADIMSILQSSYTTSALSTPSNTPYTNVDPTSYQGTWEGTYSNNQKFELSVSQVNGFRAQVKYQSGSTVQYQSVLIKDSSFRIGDTKFTLTKAQTPATAATDTDLATDAQGGTASIRTAITDPVTGSTSLITATATQDI
jgi:hypothetical protein